MPPDAPASTAAPGAPAASTTAPAVLVTPVAPTAVAPIPATASPAPTPVANAVPPPAAEAAKAPEVFVLVVDTTNAPLDDALVTQAIASAKQAGFKLVHYAPCAHPTLKEYARLLALSDDKATATIVRQSKPQESMEYPLAELFDPYVAEQLYKEAYAVKYPPAKPAPAPLAAAAAALLVVLAMLAVLGLGACKATLPTGGSTATTPTAAAATPPPSSTLPAKIGAAALKIETPAALQFEVQVTVAETLQRAVAANKQATAAAWVTNAAKGLQSFTDGSLPSGAQVEARIAQYAGPTQDPNLVLLSATIADGWDLAAPFIKSAIAANPTAVKVEDYANAAAAGALAGSNSYLAK